MPVMTIVEISAILFFATLFRTALGFGEALVGVPLLAFIIPIKVAAPLAVLASIVIASVAVIRDWRHIHFTSTYRLLVSTLFGIPLGLLLLKLGSEALVKGLLALVLFAFSAYSLLVPRKTRIRDDRYVWLFGFLAGIGGGSYGLNGPPLAIFGALRGWEPEKFRATLQGYFLPASLVGMGGYLVSGLWTSQVSSFFVHALPAIALGIAAGRLLNRRLNAKQFERMLHVGLLLVALVLLLQLVSISGCGRCAERPRPVRAHPRA